MSSDSTSKPSRIDRPGTGFSLVEMLVVIVMLAIATLIAMPVLSGYRDAQRTRGAAMQVQLAVNIAKSRAAAMNRVVRVDFAPGGLATSDGFLTIYADLDRDNTLDPGEIAAAALPNTVERASMQGYELPKGVDFNQPVGSPPGPYGLGTTADGVTFTNNAFSIFPDGTVAEAGHVTIRDRHDRSYAIALTVGGAARVFYFDGSAWK